MHYLRVFRNREFGAFFAWAEDGSLVHQSLVFPKYFRFPFMRTVDLQIGEVWTSPAWRNQGIASWAISQVVAAHQLSGRDFWYVTDQDNVSSSRAAIRAGFELRGKGHRIRRLGTSYLGAFVLDPPR
jgi:RimJ/RimL family protein N-acetyltransferase